MRVLVTTTGTVVTHAFADDMLLLDGADILIESGVISSITPSQELVQELDADGMAPSNLEVLDVGRKSVVPGLIDAHTPHLGW